MMSFLIGLALAGAAWTFLGFVTWYRLCASWPVSLAFKVFVMLPIFLALGPIGYALFFD